MLPPGSRPEGARSYLDDGRVVVWRDAGDGVVDAERRREAPAWLAARAEGDPWVWWTRLEALCKLQGVPALVALKRGVSAEGCVLRTVERDGIVMTFGTRATG